MDYYCTILVILKDNLILFMRLQCPFEIQLMNTDLYSKLLIPTKFNSYFFLIVFFDNEKEIVVKFNTSIDSQDIFK